jgi:hypothetical protein
MNRFSFIVLFLTLLVSTPLVVKAETMLRVIFNNGTNNASMSCNAAENALIDSVFNFTFRRNLRHISNDSKDLKINFLNDSGEGQREHRGLQTRAYCADKCADGAYTPGTCRVTGCAKFGFRKLKYGMGTVSNSTLCTMTNTAVSNDLDSLVSQNLVSNTCQALLKAPRVVECYEDTMYGMIKFFNLYDAQTDRPIKTAMDGGYKSCSGKLINFLVLADECVKTLNITLTGTNGYRQEKFDDKLPFTLFMMNGTSTTDYLGQVLADGNYTIWATPDGFDEKKRWRKFSVGPC